jgi:translation initiation factor IF-3
VEIAPNANPPVVRIVDFQKFRYSESKKERASKKSGGSDLKELWFSPRIAEHDLGVRLNRIDEFLKDGHKVKLTVKFRGREMAHTEFGFLVLKKALEKLGDKVAVEREAKMEGRKLSLIIAKSKSIPSNGEAKQVENGETNAKTEKI